VLVKKDENTGEIVRITQKDTAEMHLYNMMRETLIYLTHINSKDMYNILMNTLAQQMKEEHFTYDLINSFSWSVGAISGTMSL
jgi:exportin-1